VTEVRTETPKAKKEAGATKEPKAETKTKIKAKAGKPAAKKKSTE
jgi:hypothetical protein